MGASAPPNTNQATTGRLGLRFDRREYETNGRLKITEIISLSPAALTGNVHVGDYLLAVDGHTIDARTNLDELLNYKTGRRVSLSIASSATGAGKREVIVRPVNADRSSSLAVNAFIGSPPFNKNHGSPLPSIFRAFTKIHSPSSFFPCNRTCNFPSAIDPLIPL